MKLTETLLSVLLKRGLLFELRNADIDLNIPTQDNQLQKGVISLNQASTQHSLELLPTEMIKINVKAESLTIRVSREEKE